MMTLDQGPVSMRVADAEKRAQERLRHQRDLLRPLGWAVIALVVASAVTQRPRPGPTGAGLVVGIATVVYAAATAATVSNRLLTLRRWLQVGVVTTMAVAGVSLSWLQPRGATDLAAGAAAWMAITRLPLATGVAVAALAGLVPAAAAARTGSAAAVVAVLLLTVLLALVAYLVRQSRDAQTRTEQLLAQLADARDAQAEAAVVADRGRIAAELHDVLAHALSGAALQLQGARVLAERAHGDPLLTEAIQRAAGLVADGLVNARHAVRALRGDALPSLAQVDELVAGCRRDLRLDVTLQVNGTPRALPPELALALYRGVQEALTNAARHAPGAPTRVLLSYRADGTGVEVVNGEPPPRRSGAPQPDVAVLGGGNGLVGLRERLEHLGGTMHAGPAEGGGWRVVLSVPGATQPATARVTTVSTGPAVPT
jgi:signal transduction histidine kinase